MIEVWQGIYIGYCDSDALSTVMSLTLSLEGSGQHVPTTCSLDWRRCVRSGIRASRRDSIAFWHQHPSHQISKSIPEQRRVLSHLAQLLLGVLVPDLHLSNLASLDILPLHQPPVDRSRNHGANDSTTYGEAESQRIHWSLRVEVDV